MALFLWISSSFRQVTEEGQKKTISEGVGRLLTSPCNQPIKFIPGPKPLNLKLSAGIGSEEN